MTKVRMSKENLLTNHISRKVEINGISIPGIIYNYSYHIVDLKIYEDGLIDCWEFVDLPLLREKISKNWIVSSIPDNSDISVFGLGSWKINNGKWLNNKEQLYDLLESYVRKLNPNMLNLFDMKGTNIVERNGVPTSKVQGFKEQPYYFSDQHPVFPKKTYGIEQNVFYRHTHSIYLAKIAIFPDGYVIIRNIPNEVNLNFAELEEQFNNDKVITNPPLGQRVEIYGIGSFDLQSGMGVDQNSKLAELKDALAELRGEETTSKKCLRLWSEYRESPSEQKKKSLKLAYEAVPIQMRMFLGDQDSKDFPIRYDIYGDIVKKEWEDRYGFPMPSFG